jgi:hypothetical protein
MVHGRQSSESTFAFGAAVIQNGAPALPASHQRALNWSAVRDEVQDFTRNVRAVSGEEVLSSGSLKVRQAYRGP